MRALRELYCLRSFDGDVRATLEAEFNRVLKKVRAALKGTLKVNERVHPLRIKIRNARYLGEILYVGDKAREFPLVRHLHSMESALGEVHDAIQFGDWALELSAPRQHMGELMSGIKRFEETTIHRGEKRRKELRHEIAQHLEEEPAH